MQNVLCTTGEKDTGRSIGLFIYDCLVKIKKYRCPVLSDFLCLFWLQYSFKEFF